MEEFPANNRRARTPQKPPPEKKVEQVTTGPVVTRKKPLGRRVMETFFGGDAKGVLGYIFQDVLIPAAKDAISDAVSQGVERMIFGDSRGGGHRPRRSSGTGGYTSYNRFSTPTHNRDEARTISRRSRVTQQFDEILLNTRAEAGEVLARMGDLIGEYDQVTVADLYDLTGVAASFTDARWGWTDPRAIIHADIVRTRDGYLLDLPKPEQLD